MIVKRVVCAVVVLLASSFTLGYVRGDVPTGDEPPSADAATTDAPQAEGAQDDAPSESTAAPKEAPPKDAAGKGTEKKEATKKNAEGKDVEKSDAKESSATPKVTPNKGQGQDPKSGESARGEKTTDEDKPTDKKAEGNSGGEQKPSKDTGKPSSDTPKVKVADDLELITVEANIISYTNSQRAKHGLAPLKPDKTLMKSARQHCAWMARNRSMVHTRRPVAENIAMGQRSSRSAVGSWMNSSGHRANILSRGHRRIGVAAYRSPGGTIFWCQQFRR